jgi:pyridinium-3,5-bisthiocarboxylic acid mononucleotide nickel chelatase
MTHAHFDCFAGISGDMTLGAMIDLGVDPDWLAGQIRDLPLDGFALTATPVFRNGIRARQVTVTADEGSARRDFRQIVDLIETSPVSDPVRARSLAMFGKIADAESAIHGCPRDHVHFHEVGGIDAIVDIVGTALCLEKLGITSVSASPLPMGSGFVACAHGRLPVPAPATVAILKGIPVVGADTGKEMVTPTGAAIVAAAAEDFGPMPPMRPEKTGYGAGTHEFKDRPNLLRVITGRLETVGDHLHADTVAVIEAGIDDMNPEIFGFLMERLFEDGALDVCWIPVQVKKGRPGTLVQVLCPPHLQPVVVNRILSETTSIGVRHHTVQRTVLDREVVTVETTLGRVQAKRVTGPDGNGRLVPEYEACRRLAKEGGRPLREIYEALCGEFAGRSS